MTNRQRRIWAVAFVAVILLSAFALLLVLNSQTPLYKDDYSYSYTFAVKENKFRITTLKELIDSQVNHYKVMNGRIVPHTLAQAFLMTDKAVFNILNSAAFTMLVFLIYYHATKGNKNKSPALLAAAFASLFLLTPRFGESFLWLTGACNYLWGMLLILVYLVPLTSRFASDQPSRNTPFAAIGLFLLGFICAITGENTVAALIVMSALFTLYFLLKNKRLDLSLLFGLVGNIGGFLVLLLAPGQSVRLANNGGSGGLGVWLSRVPQITKVFVSNLWPLLIITAVFIIVGLILKRERTGLCKTLIFLVGGLVSVYSMVISPYFPDRVWSGPIIYFSIAALSAVSYALPSHERHFEKFVALALSVCMLVPVTHAFIQAISELSVISELDKARAEQIIAAKEQGENSVTVDTIYGDGRYTCFDSFGDLNSDSTTWPNTALAMYFDIDEVVKREENK